MLEEGAPLAAVAAFQSAAAEMKSDEAEAYKLQKGAAMSSAQQRGPAKKNTAA